MKKILYRKFLTDCSIFFIIALVSTSIIIWVIQAVNFLDIIIDDGRGYDVYLNYAILNFPKIVSKILPFAFFFSFSYVIAKYELKNELLIYWNFGINKMSFVNFFLLFSLFIFLIQIILTAYIVPKSQSMARTIIRTSNYNFVDNFIKINFDILTSVTNSPKPVITKEMINSSIHINAAGNNSWMKSEVEIDVIDKIDKIICDEISQAKIESGELLRAQEQGAFSWETASGLSEIIHNKKLSKNYQNISTLFESQGLAMEDLAMAVSIYNLAIENNYGKIVKT